MGILCATALDFWLTIALNGASSSSSSSSFYCCRPVDWMNKETHAVICKNYREGRRRRKKQQLQVRKWVRRAREQLSFELCAVVSSLGQRSLSLGRCVLMLMRTLPCCYCSLYSTPRAVAVGKQNDNCVFRKVKLAGGDLKVV